VVAVGLELDAGGEAIFRAGAFVVSGEDGVVLAYKRDVVDQALAVEAGGDAEAGPEPFLVAVLADGQRRRYYVKYRFALHREAIEKIPPATLYLGMPSAANSAAIIH
jgi:hypothetical protein